MSDAETLLHSYLDNVREPKIASALFAEDGVVELPSIKLHAKGHAEIEKLLNDLLGMVPDFKFQEPKFYIVTPDRVFAEYSVDATVAATGKSYHQMYSGVLIAENGKIKLLREALDSAAAMQAFAP